MPDFFRFASEYFWAIALAFTVFNYWKAERNITKSVGLDRVPEGKRYLRNFAATGALPWVIMGAGQVTGATPTVWHYFRPQDRSAFVLAWLATIFALSCLYAGWVFIANGAEKVVEFNLMAAFGQNAAKPPSVKMVKFFAALGVLIFPIWVYIAVSMNVPLPR